MQSLRPRELLDRYVYHVDDAGHGRNYARFFRQFDSAIDSVARAAGLQDLRRSGQVDVAAGLSHELIRGLALAHSANVASFIPGSGLELRRFSNDVDFTKYGLKFKFDAAPEIQRELGRPGALAFIGNGPDYYEPIAKLRTLAGDSIRAMHKDSMLIVDASQLFNHKGVEVGDSRALLRELIGLANSRNRHVAFLIDRQGVGSVVLSRSLIETKKDAQGEMKGPYAAHQSLKGRTFYARAAARVLSSKALKPKAIPKLLNYGDAPYLSEMTKLENSFNQHAEEELLAGRDFRLEMTQGGFGGFQNILLHYLHGQHSQKPRLILPSLTYWRPLSEARVTRNYEREELGINPDTLVGSVDQLLGAVKRRGSGVVYLPNPSNPVGQQMEMTQVEDVIRALDPEKLLVLDHTLVHNSEPHERPRLYGNILRLANQYGKKVAIVWSASKALAIPDEKVGGILWSREALSVIPKPSLKSPILRDNLVKGVKFLNGEFWQKEQHFLQEAQKSFEYWDTRANPDYFELVRPVDNPHVRTVPSSFHVVRLNLPKGVTVNNVVKNVSSKFLAHEGFRTMDALGGGPEFQNYLRIAAVPVATAERVQDALISAIRKTERQLRERA